MAVPFERKPLLDEKLPLDNLTTGYHHSPSCAHRKSSLKQQCQTSVRIAIAVASLCLTLLCGYIFHPWYAPRISSNNSDSNSSSQPSATVSYTCVPGQSCWPSESEWGTFNSSIGGRLYSTVPWAAPCYTNATSLECLAIANHYEDGAARTAQYGSMEFINWETCGASQCALDSIDPTSPLSGTCSLGRLSTYFVDVRTSDDISKTLDFVRKHGVRLSIKNTGHDYFGRSSAANSLALWTHNLKDARYHETFQPKGCKANYKNIGEIGAGIQAQEAWEFFEPLGMLVTVGAVGSVGLAGGFGQGGGHGPLGPSYGLMVDQAVEFEVVTADGQQRTINECNDPDLFWAMRGGGGGNYAVLTSYKFQLYPSVPMNVYSFYAEWDAPADITESKIHRDIVRALAANQSTFSQHGIAGYNFLLPNHMVSLQIMPSHDTEAIKKITAQWHDFLTEYPGLTIVKNEYLTFNKFGDYHDFTLSPHIARNGAVGLGLLEAGRFIPKSLFSTSDKIEELVNAVVTAMQFSWTNKASGAAQLYATGPANHADNSKTGVNPAWRDSLWHVIMGAGWTTQEPPQKRTQKQNTISASIQPFKAITPGGGCYMNEGDWMEENWKQAFFGENYDRLLEVKKRYDPTGLFNCWKCVGWTGYDE